RLELVFDIDPDVPDALIGDGRRLRQVLVSLVGSAVAFTERGEVLVAVDCAWHDGTEVGLRFAVTSTRIPPELQATLFCPFEHADGAMIRKYGGAAVALSLSSRLIESMGGELALRTRSGDRGTFLFVARFDLRPVEAAGGACAGWDGLRGLPVLIVDD